MSDLTKWPRLLVKGEPVTEHQANDILIRACAPWYLHTNDREWNTAVRCILGIETQPDSLNGLAEWQSEKAAAQRLGVLDLSYLYNSRIASSWLGGPHGWCDWDGTIGCSDYNIGKWPDSDELTKEWARIAAAFPYLDLTAQAVTNEGEGEIAAEWRILNGQAVQREPGRQVRTVREPMMLACLVPGGERGVSAERLEVAVAQVLEARAALADNGITRGGS